MRRQKYLLCLGGAVFACLMSVSAPALAQNSAPIAKELAAQKEVLQIKLDHLKETQKSDVDMLNKRIDDALATTGQAVDRFGIVMAWIASLVTVLLAGLGLLGFITVVRKTKAEAEQAAQTWFDEKAAKLREEIERLEKRAEEARLSMDASVKHVDDHAAVAKQAIDRQQAAMGRGQDDKAPHSAQSQSDVSALERRDDELRQQPESRYSFDDWNARAHAAYANDKPREAIYFWERASQVENAGAANVAKVLVNKGVAQGQAGDNAGAIASCDEVIRRFGDAPEAALREQVAKALFNKGVRQGQTGDNAGAIASYDEAIRRFGDAPEAALQETVATALVNKGNAQGRMDNNAGAIASYDEVIRRFGDAPEAALREPVARALLNKGNAQGQTGDNAGAIASYAEAIRRFGDAPEPALREKVATVCNSLGWEHFVEAKRLWKTDRGSAEQRLQQARQQFDAGLAKMATPNGMLLGNRAYTRFLQGDIAGAEADFGTALATGDHGGQWLYEATLKDLEVHPLDEDAGMRALVERVWQAYAGRG